MPKCPPPAIEARRSKKNTLLAEVIVLLCVVAVAACAGIAVHFPQWYNVSLLIGVIIMIPMCWVAESNLGPPTTSPTRS